MNIDLIQWGTNGRTGTLKKKSSTERWTKAWSCGSKVRALLSKQEYLRMDSNTDVSSHVHIYNHSTAEWGRGGSWEIAGRRPSSRLRWRCCLKGEMLKEIEKNTQCPLLSSDEAQDSTHQHVHNQYTLPS